MLAQLLGAPSGLGEIDDDDEDDDEDDDDEDDDDEDDEDEDAPRNLKAKVELTEITVRCRRHLPPPLSTPYHVCLCAFVRMIWAVLDQ